MAISPHGIANLVNEESTSSYVNSLEELFHNPIGRSHVLLGKIFENPLLICNIVGNLPISAVLNLAATSKQNQKLLYHTPSVFRRLDLSTIKSGQLNIARIDQGGETWRNVQLDENVTEDDFYAGPLRGIFSTFRRRDLLHDVTTLILDGMSVTAELVNEIITDPSFQVRILSLRDVRNLNQPMLRAALQMAVRPGRPEGTPRLKGLYIFGPKDPLPPPPRASPNIFLGAFASDLAWRKWYDTKGSVIPNLIPTEWAETMLACADIISFDAVLCRGPRHLNSPAYGSINIPANSPPPPYVPSKWSVATESVGGCTGCGSAPEGWTAWGESGGIDVNGNLHRFPLLAPPPPHSSDVKVACCPRGEEVKPSRAGRANHKEPRRFIARCGECTRGRVCRSCNKWWCEACFTLGTRDPSQSDGSYYKVRDPNPCVSCKGEAERSLQYHYGTSTYGDGGRPTMYVTTTAGISINSWSYFSYFHGMAVDDYL